MTDLDKWCDNRAAEVCERWFPAEKQSPAIALFDLVKEALREAAEKAPREWKNKADALERVLEEKLAERYTPRVLDEAELEKLGREFAFGDGALSDATEYGFKAGFRECARRNLMAQFPSDEEIRDRFQWCKSEEQTVPTTPAHAFEVIGWLRRRLGGV